MTEQTKQDTVPCTICQEQHPRQDSVTVDPPGLSCGLACMTADVRRLLGLPDPGGAAIGATASPPHIKGWREKPSKFFSVQRALPPDGNQLAEDDFRRALNVIGLAPVLRADYANPDCRTTLNISGRDVIFTFSPYTAAASRRVFIWVEGMTTDPEPRILGMARLAWADSPEHPDYDRAHRKAAEYLDQHSKGDSPDTATSSTQTKTRP